MHLKNKPPVFVPPGYRAEIEKLSKAALMDMVWDYAMQIGGAGSNDMDVAQATIEEFRKRREITLSYRQPKK
jgi:hypothetical protein